jgi:phosphatidylglycerol:prolipoprotein diacylglycerol transferase
MYPVLFKIGPLTVHSYGLMIAVGFLLALHLTQRNAQKAGIDPQAILNMAFPGLFFGILGTRILYIILFPEGFSWKDPVGLIAIWRGGLVFQGALPVAVVYAWYGARRRGIPFWKLADLVIPYVPLAHAFGRIGCFLNGCCYGIRTNLPWGIRFPRIPWDLSDPNITGSPAYYDQRFELPTAIAHWSYPVHPTQLYGFVGLLATCFVLLYLKKKWHIFDGFTMPLYFVMYSVGRFFIEFLRGDHNPTMFKILSVQQVFCILFVVAGLLLFLVLRDINRKSPQKPG